MPAGVISDLASLGKHPLWMIFPDSLALVLCANCENNNVFFVCDYIAGDGHLNGKLLNLLPESISGM